MNEIRDSVPPLRAPAVKWPCRTCIRRIAAGLAHAGAFAESWPGIAAAWMLAAGIAWHRLPMLGLLS